MSLKELLTGICAMAAICALCDMLTPNSTLRKSTRSIISLYFLLYLIDGLAKITGF